MFTITYFFFNFLAPHKNHPPVVSIAPGTNFTISYSASSDIILDASGLLHTVLNCTSRLSYIHSRMNVTGTTLSHVNRLSEALNTNVAFDNQ